MPYPWLAGIFAAALLSLAGIPLTAGFAGKFYLLAAGVGSALWLLVILLVLASAVGLFYDLRLIVAMYTPLPQELEGSAATLSIPWAGSLVLAALALARVGLGSIQRRSSTWCNGRSPGCSSQGEASMRAGKRGPAGEVERSAMACSTNTGGRMALLLLLACLVSMAEAEAGLSDQVVETTLPNGLKVILLEQHKAPLATFQVWYRVGSRNEAWGKTGLSHMLEHMMFKGTHKVGTEAFSRIIQEHGGQDNAFTSRDFTAYFEELSADQLQVAIELEADRMQNLLLRDEDFQTERLVVMEERRLRTDDNPQASLLEQLEATAYQTSPYHWPTIGWQEDIARLTLDDVKAYYHTYYRPANAFLVVVGDFKTGELLPRIEQAFGAYPKAAAPDQEKGVDPPQRGERRLVVKRPAQLPFLLMGYHVPNLREPDSYVLEVIAALLSQGKSSRLYQSLVRDKRLGLNADAEHSLLSRDSGLFLLSATPLPGKDVAAVEEALDGEIARLQSEPVAERELEKAKNQLEAAFVMAQDTLFGQAMLLAQHEIARSWRAVDDYLPAIRRVSAEDVQRVASRYLIPDNRTVGTLMPLPAPEGQTPPSGASLRQPLVR
jgi:zinc protease